MAGVMPLMFFSPTDIKHLAATYRHGGMAALKSEIEAKAKEFKNVKLNVAVMGEAGVGKSSFINALRDLDVNDEGVAPTGVVDTTMEVTPYSHPTLPNVTYSDFPGIAAKFPIKKFLKQTTFSQYDFGIIVSGNRFTESDATLAKAMKKAGIPFYFVRSKIDIDIDQESKKHGYNQEQMFQKIKEYCTSQLVELGIENPRVFLLSNNELGKYDFPDLNKSLDSDLSETKKNLFLIALPNISIDVIERKQKHLKRFIHVLATVSACIGAIPIPGLSLACDLGLLVLGIVAMQIILGVDDASIKKLALKVGKDESYLRANTQHPWVYGSIDEDLLFMLLKKNMAIMALTVAEVILDFIPIIGSIFGATSSFWVTHTMLSNSLDDLVQAAITVMTSAYKLA